MSYFDSTDLWMGDSDKSNAKIRLDSANSKIIVRSGGEIKNTAGDYSITNEGLALRANQEGLKTPPWQVPVQRVINWENSGGTEIARITGYTEDSTPTPDDYRLGLSAGDGEGVIGFYSNTFSSQLNLMEDDSQALAGGGEVSLTVNASIIGVNASSNERIARIDLGLSVANPLDASFTFRVINDGSAQFFYKDKSSASLSGANIRVAGGLEREHQAGGTLPVTFYNGTYYVGQDRN